VLPTEQEDGFTFLVTNDMAETNFTRHLHPWRFIIGRPNGVLLEIQGQRYR
jgi:hypothetical protein